MANDNELTITDVAKAAGVSVSTVSRILNGKQDVAPSTRQHVQQVIDQLGYAPHTQARRLRAGKTRTLALIFPFTAYNKKVITQLDLDFMIGAANAAGQHGFFFNLLTTPVTKQSLLSLYRSAQVDGIVLMQIHLQDWRVDLLREHGYPFVMIGHCEDNERLSYIDLDFEASILTAFDYLAQLGHQRIGFITYSHSLLKQGYGPSVRSMAGYQRALQKYHLTPLYKEVAFDVPEMTKAALALLDDTLRPTAIVTSHDATSSGIIRAASERNLRIPEHLSLVNISTELLSEMTTPPMTAIDFPTYMMGHRAVEMLVHRLENPHSQPEQLLIPPRLIIRSSTSMAS